MIQRITICIVIPLLLVSVLKSNGNNIEKRAFENRIESFRNLEIIAFYDSTLALIREFNEKDEFYTPERSQSLFQAIKNKKGIHGHRLSWIHSPEYSEEQKMRYLDNAENLARKLNDESNLAWVYLSKGEVFYFNQLHENSIKNILKAKKIYEQTGDSLNLSLSNILIGNLFFNSSLFTIALKYYQLTDKLLQGNSAYVNEKKFIINNHIVSTYIQLNDFDSAIKLLNHNLAKYYPKLNANIQNNALSYIYGLNARAFLNKGDLKNAHAYILKAISTANKDKVLLNGKYLYVKGRIEFESQAYNKSMTSALSLFDFFQENGISLEKEPGLLKLLSENYSEIKDYKTSLMYLKQYNSIIKSNELKANNIKSILLVSEQNYDTLSEKYIGKRKDFRNAITGIIVLILTLSIIAYQYIKIRKANLMLVKEGLVNEKKFYLAKEVDIAKDENLKVIIDNLRVLMLNEKPFLDSSFSLSKAAKLLSTNTSYLSEAINSILNKNFNTYINSFRIDFVIILIKKGEADRMTIEALAEKSGFKNRSVFNATFKTVTGVTPSFFIKTYKTQL